MCQHDSSCDKGQLCCNGICELKYCSGGWCKEQKHCGPEPSHQYYCENNNCVLNEGYQCADDSHCNFDKDIICCHGKCLHTSECIICNYDFDCNVGYECDVSRGLCINGTDDSSGDLNVGKIIAVLVAVLFVAFVSCLCKKRIKARRTQLQNQQHQAVDIPMQPVLHNMPNYPPMGQHSSPRTGHGELPPPYPPGQLPVNSALTDMSDAPPAYDTVMNNPHIFQAPDRGPTNNRSLPET